MSTTVDNRILEMRFDNRQFENGVATSMSTLDKLKQKLNLSGASKGLDDLGKAAKNVSFDGMNSGIETVQAKFSALQVAGVTALANITNQAVNAGKRMVSALTIDPIKTGFQEYETQIGAIQTILANTQKEGTNVETVNKALDELNTYADKTIYNFTEMTRNIGTFTAAGVKLDTSVSAIKGIANLAAISGSTSQQASTAMYQLSQALAAGKVSLMDWNSVVNAGMGGQVFQDALIRTSELLGTGAEAAIDMYGSFRESLTKGEWLTTEVLTETLNQLSGAYSKADLIAQGFTEEQANEIVKLAETAQAAATEVKTFTQLWDTLKEAAQSGWSQTWRILVGDFEEAKELFTGLSDFFGGIVGKSADNRNKILEGALSDNPFSKLGEKIEKVTSATDKLTNATEKVKNATKDYGSVVDKIIGGEFGNGEERIDNLTKAGYDWAHAQNLVNEKLGDSTRHATNYKESQEELTKSQEKVNKVQKVTIDDIIKMSDAQLKQIGFTKDEIEAFRELEEQSKKTGIPMKDLVKDIDQLNGRTLLLNAFKNAGQGLVTVFQSIGKAWKEAFYGDASEEDIIAKKTESLYNAIAAFHKFSTYLKVSDETAEKITRTFKGLFAIIDILTTIAGGGFKLAFTGLSKLLGAFDMDILDLTANIGDAIVAFRDFLFNNDLVNKGFELLASGIKKAADAFKSLMDAIGNIPQVQALIDGIKNAINNLQNIDLTEVGQNIIQGLQNGLGDGVQAVWNKMVEIGQGIIDAIKGILGIHSPSTVMIAIGGFIIAGLILGLKTAFPDVWDTIAQLGEDFINKCKETFNNISWGNIFSAALAVGMIYFVKQLSDAIGGIAHAFDGIGDMFNGVSSVLFGFDKVLKSFSWDLKAKAMQKMAIAIAILAASVAVLSRINPKELWNAVGVIAALSAILVALGFAMDKMTQASLKIEKGGASIEGMKSGLIQIGVSLLLLAATVKLVGSMNPEEATQGFLGLAGMILALVTVFTAFGVVAKYGNTSNIDKLGGMALKLSLAMMLLVGVCKLVGMLKKEEMIKGAAFAGAFILFITALSAASKLGTESIGKIGGMALKLSLAMMLLVGVCKLVGMLKKEEMIKGAAFAGAFLVFVGALVLVSKMYPTAQIQKISGLVLSITVSLSLMVGVCKLVGLLSPEEMIKGGVFATAFLGLVAILVKVCTIGSEQQMAKVAASILAFSISIGILAAVCMVMSLLDISALAKGLTAVTLLGGIMTAMIWATRGANDVKSSIIAMSVAIGVMAAAIAVLSMIDTGKLIGASAAMSMVMGMFAVILKASNNIKASIPALITMSVAIGLLAGVLYLLSGLPVESTLGSAAALSVLLMSLAASMTIVSKFGTLSGQAIVSIGAMTLVVGALGLIIGTLTKLDNIDAAIPIAISLSALLGALTACTAVLAVVGLGGPAALIGIGSLMALIVGVGGLMLAIGALVTYIPQMETFIDTALPILGKIGQGIGEFIGGIGEGISGSFVQIGNDIVALMTQLSVASMTASTIKGESFDGVKQLMDVMGDIALMTVGTTLSDIFTFGGTSMEKFQTDGVAFFNAMKEISTAVNGVSLDEESFNSVISAASKLSQLQSSLEPIGGVMSWFNGRDDLATFGVNIGYFMDSMSTAMTSLNEITVNPEALTAVIDAATKLSTLQSSLEPMGGVISWFTGRDDLGKFGTCISSFMDSMSAAMSTLNDVTVNPEALTAVIDASTKLAELQSSLEPMGGVIDWFTGQDDLGSFGEKVALFGESMGTFSEKIGTGIDEAAVTSVINAGTMITELQKALPEEGWFDGKMNLTEFSNYISNFSTAMSNFSTKAENMDISGVDSAITAANRIKNLIQSLVGLDTSGIAAFTGIGTGGLGADGAVSDIGKAISDFSNETAGIDIGKVDTSVSAALKLKNLISGLSGLDASGIENFKVDSIGNTLKSYAGSISGLDIGIISLSIMAASKLKSFIGSLAEFDGSGVESFKSAVNALATTNIQGLVSAFSASSESLSMIGTNIINSIITGLQSGMSRLPLVASSIMSATVSIFSSQSGILASAGVSMINGLAIGLESGRSRCVGIMSSLMATMIASVQSRASMFGPAGISMTNGLAQGIRSGTPNCINAISVIMSTVISNIRSRTGLFNASGIQLMTAMAMGMMSAQSLVTSAASSAVSGAVSGVMSHYSSFHSAGVYLGSGLVIGIQSMQSAAYNAGYALGQAAAQGEKDGQDSHSPSKLTIQAGKWLGEGLIIGIEKMGTKVYKAGHNLGDSAANSMTTAVSKIADAINSDIDSEPTIRPVLDLSEIKAGVGTIDKLMDMQPSIKTLSSVGAVNSMMNRRNQNGGNDEIITAMDKIRKELGNVGNTSYTINGITYDDGSNVSEAIKLLIRAARIEGRM